MPRRPDQAGPAPIPADCIAQARVSQEWFATRVLPLTLGQLRWRPRRGAWSIAECLDHLNRTLDYYLPKIEQAIGQNPCKLWGGNPGPMCRKMEMGFLTQFEPPIRKRGSTPPQLQPAPPVDPDRIVDPFPHLRERYARAVLLASRLDLANISIADSIHAPVESLGGVIALLAAHDRRHLWQAERIRKVPGFPATPDPAASLDDRIKR